MTRKTAKSLPATKGMMLTEHELMPWPPELVLWQLDWWYMNATGFTIWYPHTRKRRDEEGAFLGGGIILLKHLSKQ